MRDAYRKDILMKKSLSPDVYTQTLSEILEVIKTAPGFDELFDCSVDASEDSLLTRLRNYLIEVDKGLALVGQQYHMKVDNDDISIDLLFYHILFKCYIVVELMPCSCSPKDASQLNYYLAIVDHMLSSPVDNPAIGLLINKDGPRITARYALRDEKSAQKVFSCALIDDEELPEVLQQFLPSCESIEEVLMEQ